MLGASGYGSMDGTGLGVKGARVIELAYVIRVEGGDISKCIP